MRNGEKTTKGDDMKIWVGGGKKIGWSDKQYIEVVKCKNVWGSIVKCKNVGGSKISAKINLCFKKKQRLWFSISNAILFLNNRWNEIFNRIAQFRVMNHKMNRR